LKNWGHFIITFNYAKNDHKNEDYIIFNSNRPGGYGGLDLYISFANGSGGWTTPQNLGPNINSSGNDDSPYLSPDYKYLFFARTNSAGEEDIYWVDVRALGVPEPSLIALMTMGGLCLLWRQRCCNKRS